MTLSAVVTAGATGSVTFLAGGTILGAATVSNGRATLATSLLPSGMTLLRAQYAGDSTYGPSQSPAYTQIVKAAAAGGFAPYASYKVGATQWIGLGDFTGDGKADLITFGNPTVSVLPANGNGTFGAAINTTLPNNLYGYNGVVVGDFNGDGKLDLIILLNNDIYLLPGNGDGSFQAPVQVEPNTNLSFTGVVTADFNRDGKPDLAAYSVGNLYLILGNGDGTFQPPAAITTNGSYSNILLALDLNGDANPDLVAGLVVFLGNGDGTFQAPVSYSPSNLGGPGLLAAGDFNGDGLPDLASVTWEQVQVFLDSANGTLGAPHNSALAFLNGNAAVTGDFNGDGKIDLAYASFTQNAVALAFGNGDGTFQYTAWQDGSQFTTDSQPNWLVAGDFNGDGRTDLAVVTYSGYVDIFLGGQYSGLSVSATHYGNFTSGATGTYQIAIQNQTFTPTSGAVTVTDTLPNGLTATAISGNGWTCTLSNLTCTRSDVLNTSAGYPPITIAVNVAHLAPTTLTNNASVSYGGITNPASDPTGIVSPTTTSLAVFSNPANLGQPVTMAATVTAGAAGTVLFFDGGTPLGSATISGGQASFTTTLLAPGLRALTATYSGDSTHAASISAIVLETVAALQTSGFGPASTYSTGIAPSAMAMGDFDRNGKPDLVIANSTSNNISVLLNNGNGTFASHVDYAAGTAPSAVAVGDFNGDGKSDIAVANQNSNNVSILLGNGDGTFQTAVNYMAGNEPAYLAMGDFNSDGKIDLAVGDQSQSITLLLGNGDGTFSTAAGPTGIYGLYGVSVGDFNRDGKSDLVYFPYYSGGYVLLGNGDGTFANPTSVSGASPTAAVLADLNADGKQDIVGAGSSIVWVALGNGDGTFKNYVSFNTPYPATALAAADLNGDGNLDLVTTNNNGSFSVLYGNGDGTLQPPITYSNIGNNPSAIVAGDFTGDGKIDLAIANTNGNSVTVLLGILTPVLTVTSTHTDPFALGQAGATYSLTVTNYGPGTTSGAITVADILPTGITATNIAGTNWNCTLATVSCTRSDSLGVGKSYPSILVTVTVGSISTSSVTNEVTASGGGAVTATALDSTTIGGVPVTLETSPGGLSVSLDGGAPVASPQTPILLSGPHTIAVVSPQAGPAGTQYVFTQWSDSPTAGASRTITVGSAPATYTATFKTQYQLTTSINPWPGGTVAPASGSFLDAGSTVTLTATPAPPYQFTAWSGAAGGSSAQTTVTMNSAESVTALFNVPGFTCAITGDQTPSISDVQMIVNEALGAADPKHDLNHDTVVNIGDVQKLINAALGYECPY